MNPFASPQSDDPPPLRLERDELTSNVITLVVGFALLMLLMWIGSNNF